MFFMYWEKWSFKVYFQKKVSFPRQTIDCAIDNRLHKITKESNVKGKKQVCKWQGGSLLLSSLYSHAFSVSPTFGWKIPLFFNLSYYFPPCNDSLFGDSQLSLIYFWSQINILVLSNFRWLTSTVIWLFVAYVGSVRTKASINIDCLFWCDRPWFTGALSLEIVSQADLKIHKDGPRCGLQTSEWYWSLGVAWEGLDRRLNETV